MDMIDKGSQLAGMPDAKVKESKLMVWHKLESLGHRPGAREGHAACSRKQSMMLFGGVEAGLRMNGVHEFNVHAGHWGLWSCTGEAPAPRAFHALCSYNDKYMFVQGGECTDRWTPPAAAGDMTQVCMGDSIAMNNFRNPTKVEHSTQGSAPGEGSLALRCLDDLHMLDLESKHWTKVASSLSPLPRRGHSLNVVTLNLQNRGNKNFLFLFGGFSPDTNVVGNSVHICKTEDATNSRGVAWRLLPCTGALPPARHRHTATPVWSAPDARGSADLIVVSGGLDEKNNVLSDLYVLDLKTLVWTVGGEGGSVEPPTVYGQQAFSAPPVGLMVQPGELRTYVADTAVVLFGGSSNSSNACLDCMQKMYAYDVLSKKWSVVDTGFEYPAQRSGHAMTLIRGWAPENSTPSIPASENGSSNGNSSSINDVLAKRVPKEHTFGATALVFGGLNANSMCRADVWALDLEWRLSGVAQYDDSIGSISNRELLKVTQGKTGADSIQLLGPSSSEGDLHKLSRKKKEANERNLLRSKSGLALSGGDAAVSQKLPPLSDMDPGLSDTVRIPPDANAIDLEEIGAAIHKVKREKIFADLQAAVERERADRAEAELARLRLALDIAEERVAQLSQDRELEGAELRRALEDSVEKGRRLEALNEEAYSLLLLQGGERKLDLL